MIFLAIRSEGLLSVEGVTIENLDLTGVLSSTIKSVKYSGDKGEKILTDDSVVKFTDTSEFTSLLQLHADNKKDAKARKKRNSLLLISDWTQLPDVDLIAAKIAEWATYRQDLRDVPQQELYPDTISWPTKPTT